MGIMAQARSAMVLRRLSEAAQSLRACRLAPVGTLASADRTIHTSCSVSQQPAAAASNDIEVTVNGAPVSIPKGSTVMAACSAAGIDIPR